MGRLLVCLALYLLFACFCLLSFLLSTDLAHLINDTCRKTTLLPSSSSLPSLEMAFQFQPLIAPRDFANNSRLCPLSLRLVLSCSYIEHLDTGSPIPKWIRVCRNALVRLLLGYSD